MHLPGALAGPISPLQHYAGQQPPRCQGRGGSPEAWQALGPESGSGAPRQLRGRPTTLSSPPSPPWPQRRGRTPPLPVSTSAMSMKWSSDADASIFPSWLKLRVLTGQSSLRQSSRGVRGSRACWEPALGVSRFAGELPRFSPSGKSRCSHEHQPPSLPVTSLCSASAQSPRVRPRGCFPARPGGSGLCSFLCDSAQTPRAVLPISLCSIHPGHPPWPLDSSFSHCGSEQPRSGSPGPAARRPWL